MRAKFVGNKADRVIMNVKNGESSASIPRGTPVVLKLSETAATDDGLAVVLPATAGNPNSYGLKYGVVTDTLVAGQLGESILFGVATYAIIIRATRANDSANWSASASTASGIGLGLDTAFNGFSMGASIAGGVASNAMMAILLDSLAAVASSASSDLTGTASDTRSCITVSARVFVRML